MEDSQALDLPAGLRDVMYDTSQLQTYEEFKLAKGKEIHPGFMVETAFSPKEAVFRIPQSNQLESILSSFHDGDTGTDTDTGPPDRNPSWDDVLDCIQKGKEAYEAKGTNNPVPGLIRKGKEVACILNSFVQLIPDEKGLSVLKWGLSFIFKMWINRIENAGRVIEVLGDIPQLFSRSWEMWKSYPKDDQIRSLVEDYYETVLDSVTKLLAILLRTHKKEAKEKAETKLKSLQQGAKQVVKKIGIVVKDIGKQTINADAEDIDGIISGLDKSRGKVYDRVDALDRQLRIDTNRAIHADHRATEAVRKTVSSIPNQLKLIEHCLGKKIEEARELSPDAKAYIDHAVEQAYDRGQEKGATDVLELIQKEFGMSRRGVVRSMPVFCAELIQTGFYGLTAEDEYKRRELEWSSTIGRPQPWGDQQNQYPPPIRLNSRTVPLTAHQLLEILDIDHELPIKDEQNVLRQSHAMRPEALGHARWLMSTGAFKNWLTSPGSNVLVADGHCVDMAVGRTSPLSVFCASLAASLSQSHSFIVLDFFCGQHLNSQDKNSGPRGLIRSLINQLLLYPDKPDPALGFMEESLYNGLRVHNPVALCQVFEELLRQIDVTKTIFCIIDNVSDFEPEMHGWSGEINDIMDNLLRIIRTSGRFPPAKLLVTSANRSRLVQKIDASEHISLMARQAHSRPLLGRGFDQDVQQLMPSMAPRSTPRLLPYSPRTTGMPWSRNNLSHVNIQGSLQPGAYDSQQVQRVRSMSSLRYCAGSNLDIPEDGAELNPFSADFRSV